MTGILRFVGILNAAVWVGATLFFTAVILPAVFSPEMKSLLQNQAYFPGAIAQLLFDRFFIVHYCCGTIALVHFLAEWLYSGRGFERFTFGMLIGILVLSLVGGLWVQPRLKQLHEIKYVSKASPAEKEAAEKMFWALHGSSQLVNLFVAVGLIFYLWRVTTPTKVMRHSFSLPS